LDAAVIPIERAIEHTTARLDSVIGTGTYSLGFAIDLIMFTAQRPNNPAFVLDEIAALEGMGRQSSTTKRAMPFKGKHLRGYWHKHHMQPRFMPHNLLNEMVQDETVERVLAPHMGEVLTPEILDRLTHALVHENYFRRLRERRLTGEWIVYSIISKKHHYLTLAERVHRYEGFDRRVGRLPNGQSRRP